MSPATPDWRELLKELVQSLDERAWGISSPPSWHEVNAARAALTQPEPEDDVALLRAALEATAAQRRAEDDARIALAPAGEVAELAAWLRMQGQNQDALNLPGVQLLGQLSTAPFLLTRAVALLERQAANPMASFLHAEDVIQAVKEIREDPDDCKDYEDNYRAGWTDACNAILDHLNAETTTGQQH